MPRGGSISRSEGTDPRESRDRPTASGREIFREWLGREIRREDVISRIDELTLRFSFHAFQGSNRATCRFLQRFLNEIEGHISELCDELRELPEGTPIQAQLAMQSGLDVYRTYRRWAQKALPYFLDEES